MILPDEILLPDNRMFIYLNEKIIFFHSFQLLWIYYIIYVLSNQVQVY